MCHLLQNSSQDSSQNGSQCQLVGGRVLRTRTHRRMVASRCGPSWPSSLPMLPGARRCRWFPTAERSSTRADCRAFHPADVARDGRGRPGPYAEHDLLAAASTAGIWREGKVKLPSFLLSDGAVPLPKRHVQLGWVDPERASESFVPLGSARPLEMIGKPRQLGAGRLLELAVAVVRV